MAIPYIRIKNIPLFTKAYTLTQRDNWLFNLKKAFKGKPRYYYININKILFILNYMEFNFNTR